MDCSRPKASSRLSVCSRRSEYDPDDRRVTLNTISSLMPHSRVSTSNSNLQSQWEILMRKFSKDCKTTDHICKSFSKIRTQGEILIRMLSVDPEKHDNFQNEDLEGITCETRPLKKFTTGSTYEGTWDAIGICGYGTYTFPNGVIYQGEFEDNMFHGEGEMRYPDGTILRGKWNYGDLIERTIVFSDGIHYKEQNWDYCKEPDRRYAREYTEGIQPAGRTYITKDGILRDIPDGMYDVGDGIFDPVTGDIFDYDDRGNVIRYAGSNLKKWIIQHCRKSSDGPVGPQPQLYKEWLDVTLEAPEPPLASCLSDESSDKSIPYTPSSAPSLWRYRPSRTSWSRKLKFDQDVTTTADSLRSCHRGASTASEMSHRTGTDSFVYPRSVSTTSERMRPIRADSMPEYLISTQMSRNSQINTLMNKLSEKYISKKS